MRILFILPRQHPNQAGWYHALLKAGHDVKYIVSYSLPLNERQDLPEPFKIDGVRLPFLYSLLLRTLTLLSGKEIQKPYWVWPDRRILKKEIEGFSPDIIIIRECLTPLSLAAQSIARKKGIPAVHYSQAPIQKKDGLIFKLLRGFKIVPKFRMSPTIDPAQPASNKANAFYIPLFVPAALDIKKEEHDHAVRLLFVGKYIKRKNHLLLIDAYNEIIKTHKVTLTMLGSTVFADEGYHAEVLDRIKDLNLTDHISLEYDVDPLRMSEVYGSHDVFVLPSIDEPFSISPLEAMAYGLPVIVSDTNGCRFHIRDGENGFVVKSDDLHGLIQSLEKMLDKKNLKDLKKGALEYALNRNNESNFLDHFERMSKTIISDIN